jgi:hypothetical protein
LLLSAQAIESRLEKSDNTGELYKPEINPLLKVTTNLVAEPVRAAKGVGKLPHSERRRLLQRGVAASGALRGLLTKTGKVAPIDQSAERVIGDIAKNVEAMSDETVARALLALGEATRLYGDAISHQKTMSPTSCCFTHWSPRCV